MTVGQFQETAEYRGRLLLAVGVMANHFHLLVGVPGDPDPDALLGDSECYASRALNRRYGKPACGTWWTEPGSKRKKAGPAILAAVDYIRRQYRPLVIWVNEEAVRLLASGGRQPPVDRAGGDQSASGGRQPPVVRLQQGANASEQQGANASEQQGADAGQSHQDRRFGKGGWTLKASCPK